MNVTQLTPQQYRRAADLKEKIDVLENELNELLGAPAQAPAEAPGAPKKRFNAATLAKMRKAQKERWARIRAGKAATAAKPAPTPATASPKTNGKITVKGAILKALASGKPMGKKEIAAKVSMYRGKKTKPDSISPTLNEMKSKDKTVANPTRGLYKLK